VPDNDDGALAHEMAQRVGQLRASYPPGLEYELDEQWRRVKGRAHDDQQASANEALEALGARRFSVPQIEMTSGFPGGSAVHKLVTKTVERHLTDLVTQLDAYAELTLKALGLLAAAIEDGQEETRGQVAAMTAELADLRRTINRTSEPE
jgi:hypothetical protein